MEGTGHRRDRRSKSLYVVKDASTQAAELDPRKRSESRSLYVIKTSDETVNKYADVVYDFVDDGGVFLVITRDKNFYQSVKTAFNHELGIDLELIRVLSDPGELGRVMGKAKGEGLKPFVFLEHVLDGVLTIPQLQFLECTYPEVPVVVVAKDVFQDRLFQFHEEGAENFLTKPASVNTVIEKAAFTLKPQCEVDALLNEGRVLLRDNQFEAAIDVANTVLMKRPNHPAALVILGDSYKGLARRQEARRAYENAERHAKMYLEPIKRLIMFHAEDNNRKEMLGYLTKLDTLSPLNCNRKIKIAELHMEMGQPGEAEKFLDKAIESARREAMSVVSEMGMDIGDMLAESNPQMAAKYYRMSLDFTKNSKGAMGMSVYNRLGITLRKQGMWQEAIEAYFEAEKYSPKDENIQYNIALAYAEGEDFKNAADRLLKALHLNPEFYVGHPEVAQQIGVIFKKAGQMQQGRQLFRKLQQAKPHPETQDILDSLDRVD